MEQELKYLRELLDLDSNGAIRKSDNNLTGKAVAVEPNVLNSREDKIKALNRRESINTVGLIQ